jgi:hypothetical protein
MNNALMRTPKRFVRACGFTAVVASLRLIPSLPAQSAPGGAVVMSNASSGVTAPALSLVAKAPAFCRWTTVETIFSPKAPPQKKTVTVTRTGQIASQKVEENGNSHEVFRAGPVEYTDSPRSEGGGQGGVFLPPGSVVIDDGNFSEFSWISPRFFLGIMTLGNQRCAVYADVHGRPLPAKGEPEEKLAQLLLSEPAPGTAQPKRLPGILPGSHLEDGIRIACVNAETHFPSFLQNGFTMKAYGVQLLPAREQTLPKQLREHVEAVVKANKAMFSPYARP